MSNLSVSFNRTLCFFMRIRNCRYYNVKKFLHKGKLRGCDDNVRSTDTRKSGKKSGFKDKTVSSSKTRYDSDKIRISKLYASLQNAIMESVLEKTTNAERMFHKHFKNRENVEDIGDIIRRRLEIHSVSHLDNFKKIELSRSQKQKEVKKHSNRIDKFDNQDQTAAFNKMHDVNNDVAINIGYNNKEIKAKNEIDRLENTRRIISAMANSQSITMSDKLAESDCLNYYKWNRKFNQNIDFMTQKTSNNVGSDEKVKPNIQSDIRNMESVSPKSSNNLEIHEKSDSGIRYDVNKGSFTENSIYDSFDREQNDYIELSSINDTDKDTSLKNTAYSVNSIPSLEDSEPPILRQDQPEVIQLSDGKTLEFQNSFEKRIADIDDDLCTKNDEEIIPTNSVLEGDGIFHVASCAEKSTTNFEIDIQQVNEENSLENSSAVTQEKLDHRNKDLPVESLSTLNLDCIDEKSNDHLEQKNTENILGTLSDNKIHQEQSESLSSKPTSKDIDKQGEGKKPVAEGPSNSSKHLIDLMEFISGSKSQFSNLKKQLELFGLYEEAENLEVFSKSINRSLEQTILDDVSSYLLGLQKSLLTYCSDNIGEQYTGISNRTTIDNVVSVLDEYLKKSGKAEINKNENKHILKMDNECVACNESSIIENTNKTSNDVHKGEENTEKISDKEKPFSTIKVDRLVNSNSINNKKSNLNISNNILPDDTEEYDIGKEFAKYSDKGIADDQCEIGINNTNDGLSGGENKFVDDNEMAFFDVSDDSGRQIFNNNSRDISTSKYINNDFVEERPIQSATVKSFSTCKIKKRHDVDGFDKIDSFTSDKNKESSLKSEKIDNSLLLSTEQSETNSIDDNSVSGDSKGPLKESLKKELNSDPGKVSKLQNKKLLKAKTFLHPNYWKTHANSYHTSRGIPWVIGKKCLIETIEVDLKSQNNGINGKNIVTSEPSTKVRNFQSFDYGCESGKIHSESKRKANIGNQSIRSFNTCSKTRNLFNRAHKSDELKFLNNKGDFNIKNTTSKRNYSTDHEETEVPRLEREKKKLSVRELFPEKKKVHPPIQTERNSEKEDIKLEVIGKKIIPQEILVEDETIPKEVLVETAEEFLPSKSKYGISVSDIENFEKQTQSSLDESNRDDSGTYSKQFSAESDSISDKKSHEITEEMILDGFGLLTSSSISENLSNLAGTSVTNSLNEDDRPTSQIVESNPETSPKLENHTETEVDENKPGGYDKAPIGFMQSSHNNHVKRSEENTRNFRNTKLKINNYEEI